MFRHLEPYDANLEGDPAKAEPHEATLEGNQETPKACKANLEGHPTKPGQQGATQGRRAEVIPSASWATL